MEYNLDNTINHRIATLAILLKRQVYRIIAENNLEITPEQWVIMYYLWKENGLSIGEIAAKSKKDFGNVTRIIDKLEKLEYVNKRKNDKDSRIINIYLLPKAEDIKEPITKCWEKSTNITLKGISDSEQEILLNILNKIENNILENLE
ncbi:MAG: MarR family transcriptional regulator [Paludibacteraceae bacterium]|nr:MarR family transcriptional regulator [Paludibacteraceae bacterium]